MAIWEQYSWRLSRWITWVWKKKQQCKWETGGVADLLLNFHTDGLLHSIVPVQNAYLAVFMGVCLLLEVWIHSRFSTRAVKTLQRVTHYELHRKGKLRCIWNKSIMTKNRALYEQKTLWYDSFVLYIKKYFTIFNPLRWIIHSYLEGSHDLFVWLKMYHFSPQVGGGRNPSKKIIVIIYL